MPRADGQVYFEDGDVFMPTGQTPLRWWIVTELFTSYDGSRGASRPLGDDEVHALILAAVLI